MEKKVIVLLLITSLVLGCSKVLKTKKQLEGHWEIISITENDRQILYEITLNQMSILDEGGFLPDKLFAESHNLDDTDLISYYLFFRKEQSFVFFETTNDFFNDTFQLDFSNEYLILKTDQKFLKAIKDW